MIGFPGRTPVTNRSTERKRKLQASFEYIKRLVMRSFVRPAK